MGKAERHARDWKPTTLQAVVDARELYKHSSKIMSNPKVFKPGNDFMSGTLVRIHEETLSVYMNAWSANRINAVTHPERFAERQALQDDAILGCQRLLCLFELAKSQFHLDSSKFWYWMGMLVDLGAKLRAWRDSDAKRFGGRHDNDLDAQQDGCRLNASRQLLVPFAE